MKGRQPGCFRKKEKKNGKNLLVTDFPQGHCISEQDVSGRANFDLTSVWSIQRKVGD